MAVKMSSVQSSLHDNCWGQIINLGSREAFENIVVFMICWYQFKYISTNTYEFFLQKLYTVSLQSTSLSGKRTKENSTRIEEESSLNNIVISFCRFFVNDFFEFLFTPSFNLLQCLEVVKHFSVVGGVESNFSVHFWSKTRT